jgi:Ca2+-binding EF-hand superfamily protein
LVLAAFKKEDLAGGGTVSRGAFERVTSAKLRMRLSKADAKALGRALDSDGAGQLRREQRFTAIRLYTSSFQIRKQ